MANCRVLNFQQFSKYNGKINIFYLKNSSTFLLRQQFSSKQNLFYYILLESNINKKTFMHQYQNRINPPFLEPLKQNFIVSESSVQNLQQNRPTTPYNPKRFTRKHCYGQLSRSPANGKGSFKVCRSPKGESKNSLSENEIKIVHSSWVSAKNISNNSYAIENQPPNRNYQADIRQTRTFSQLSVSPSLQSSKFQPTQAQFHNQQDTCKEDKSSKKSFFKSQITKSFKLIRQSQPQNSAEIFRDQNVKLKKENDYFQRKMAYLQQTYEKQNECQRKSYEEKFEKMKKQIEFLHSSLMKQQSTSLNLQKKLKDANSELQIFKQERNLIVGQLAKLSRAKLPKQFIDFQSCKEVCLQFQLNQIRNRLNEDKTKVQKQLQQELYKHQINARKLQQQINKYEIANRMLLKRAEQAQKLKENHKNCGNQYKKLKEKYNETLDQYYQLKKRNIQLLKANNITKNKLKETPNNNTLSIECIVKNHYIESSTPSMFKKNNGNLVNQIEQTQLFDINLSAIKTSNNYGSKIQTTNNSEMSLQFSLDYSTQVETTQFFK